jgi:hypothetical protein
MSHAQITPIVQTDPPGNARRPDKAPPDRFHLLIDCRDEETQRRLYQRFVSQGFKCRVLVL